MITEGMIGIAVLESPLQLEMRLRSFLEHGRKGGGERQSEEEAPSRRPRARPERIDDRRAALTMESGNEEFRT
jgi:hypothetical protein